MKPRVLVYVDALFQTSETFVTALLDYVGELDVDLTVLTHSAEGQQADENVVVLPRHSRRGSLRWVVDRTLRTLADRELFELGLRRFLRAHRFDVLHAQFGQPGWYLWRALQSSNLQGSKVNREARLIVNFYGYDGTGLLRDAPFWRRRYQQMFADPRLRVVVEGPRMKEELAALGCPEERIEVIPLCLRLQPGAREIPPRQDGKRVLGFVGRFVEKKGILFALENLAGLLAAEPRLELRLVGDGPDRPRIEELLRRHGIEGRVTFAGMLSYERMLQEIQGMSALLVPSHTAANGDSEGGAPTILAEAQILGVPIIASSHADIPHVLVDHTFLFPEKDGPGLAAAVRRWLADGENAYDVHAAREETERRYDRTAIQRRYAELYGLPHSNV